MNREEKLDGWYYKKDGQTFGPVSTLELGELMALGRITPRQAIWKQEGEGVCFVTAATAIKEKEFPLR